jgi:hypothetical protein
MKSPGVAAGNSALKKELAECKAAAVSDRALLAGGLRLALANEALEIENALLRRNAAQQVGRSEPANPPRGSHR